jgi:hypothetical protein
MTKCSDRLFRHLGFGHSFGIRRSCFVIERSPHLMNRAGWLEVLRLKTFPIIVIAALLIGCGGGTKREPWLEGAKRPNNKWGYYSDSPITRWDPDGRNMTLLNELRYTDPNGEVWIAPAGSVVDGASIPKSLWSIMGGPFEGKYRNASVLHDVSYDQHKRPWQDCDRMFYHAMRCSGVSAAEAGTMYYALYKFGHHWKFPIRKAKPLSKKERMALAEPAQPVELPRAIPVNSNQIDDARDWIRNTEPSLEQIEQRADAEPR